MKFLRELVRQRGLRNVPHDVDDIIARAGEWVENVDVLVRQRGLEFGLQNTLNAGNHEIHERLRRINDAMRVRHLDAKALEEAFIHRVEERLFLLEISDGCGSIFDCAIEML